jgi:GTP-binding protein
LKETRIFSTNTVRDEEEEKQMSNRSIFRETPIIPSILSYIEKIGVGMRSKRPTHARRKSRSGFGGKSETLGEIAEAEFFAENKTQHRLQRLNKDRDSISNVSRGQKATKKSSTNNQEGSEKRGAYWLPPPPFSSSLRSDDDSLDDSFKGPCVIRRPVKLLGKAGSLHHVLPRESKGLSEVAIAGRSNVGKSTLLNALLYGNTDESLSPRKFQRGGTPDTTKLPKGVKAMTSSKPGQTKELTFYQLTADVVSEDHPLQKMEEEGKMSLLLVDLPGYGFAFAKEERTVEWTNLMHYYLLERKSLKRILFLLDARHGFKKADFDFLGDLQDGLMAKSDSKKVRIDVTSIRNDCPTL